MYFLLSLALMLVGCSSNDIDVVVEPDTVQTAASSPFEYVMDDVSHRVFSEVMAEARARELHELPIGEVMQELGLSLGGKPYVAGILDAPGEESLICRLDGFDCVTFVETVLSMARTVKAQDYSEEAFRANLLETRYRDGEMDGYCSRPSSESTRLYVARRPVLHTSSVKIRRHRNSSNRLRTKARSCTRPKC